MSPALVLSLALAVAARIPERERNGLPHLRSESVIVRWADTGEVVLKKNPDVVRPLASVTKLLSALVLVKSDALRAGAAITVTEDDKDRVKWSRSRLPIGTTSKADELFDLALVASDNRAMHALVRTSSIGRETFVERMNALAKELGMTRSRFEDPAGISAGNVSTAGDVLLLLAAVAADERVRPRTARAEVEIAGGTRTLRWPATNRLVRSGRWGIVAGKTGYTCEAGRNLAIRATISGRPVDMVFLGAREMASVFGDAGRVRRWLLERAQYNLH